MLVGVHGDKMCLLEFQIPDRLDFQKQRINKYFDGPIEVKEHPLFEMIEEQLQAYFDGELKSFSIPLDLTGGDFQSTIWNLLTQIPYGKTISYGQLAVMAGDQKKVRAVGRANGENRIAIVVPCHRVIGADGSLIGYGGELWRKQLLLDLERKFSGQPVQAVFDF